MRTAFIETLCEVAQRDERVWLICGDLGYSVLEVFAARFPGRFVNAGVAEQNMTGLAAGLALSGKTVFTYSIANFPVMRCLEQIRNDICYHKLNVKVVAVGGGYAYGGQGYTHHGVEDLAVLRVMPNMTVLAPADPVETRLATRAVASWQGPCYLRLGRGGEPNLHNTIPAFKIGQALTLRDGTDLTVITTGAVLDIVLDAAEALSQRGVTVRVLSLPSLCPVDAPAIRSAALHTGRILTVEEHGVGGLGSVVAELLAESGRGVRFKSLRLPREPAECAGSQAFLRTQQGLSRSGVLAAAHALLATERALSWGEGDL